MSQNLSSAAVVIGALRVNTTNFLTSTTNPHSVPFIIGFSDMSLQIIGMKSDMLLVHEIFIIFLSLNQKCVQKNHHSVTVLLISKTLFCKAQKNNDLKLEMCNPDHLFV